MQPLGTNVIVRPLYDPDKAGTGLSPGAPALYLGSKDPMSYQGIVVASGPDQTAIFPGDHVLYRSFICNPFRVNGTEFLQVPSRYLVGVISKGGQLLPLPDDVVVKPEFASSGRPVKEGLLWIPRQVFGTEVPCTGKVLLVGSHAQYVQPGQRVLFPPEAGYEVGLKEVFYTIPEKEILAVLKTDLPVSVMVTTNWR